MNFKSNALTQICFVSHHSALHQLAWSSVSLAGFQSTIFEYNKILLSFFGGCLNGFN
jgi:hypothetical protein